MNDIIQLINAKRKAIAVIESCETAEQLKGADKYVELLNEKFNDYMTYTDLKSRVREKEVKCL